MSYYQTIDGVRYERSLLEFATRLTSGRGDGRLSFKDVQALLAAAQDSKLVTPTEYRTLEYILERFKFTQKGIELLRTELLQTPFERQVNGVVRGEFGLKKLQLVIDEVEVKRQQSQFSGSVDFPLALREMINHFINGADSSTSLRDVAFLELQIDFDDMEARRPKIIALIDQGTLQLFPTNYLALIQNGTLDFKYPIFEQPIETHWAFGLRTPALADYYFIGFVNRNDWYDVYHTGYK
jgi:hypothetical protein